MKNLSLLCFYLGFILVFGSVALSQLGNLKKLTIPFTPTPIIMIELGLN